MKKVDEFHIKRFIPSHIYQKGKEYFLKGKVNHLLFDRNYRVWTATEQGLDEYFVEADIRKLDQGKSIVSVIAPPLKRTDTANILLQSYWQLWRKRKQEWGHLHLHSSQTTIL